MKQLVARCAVVFFPIIKTASRRFHCNDYFESRVSVHPEMSAQFTKCFLDMRRKNRYSVLGLDEQPTIKDGYLIALARGEQPPSKCLSFFIWYLIMRWNLLTRLAKLCCVQLFVCIFFSLSDRTKKRWRREEVHCHRTSFFGAEMGLFSIVFHFFFLLIAYIFCFCKFGLTWL